MHCINHKFETYIMCVIVGGGEKEDEREPFATILYILCTYLPTSSTTKRHLVTLEIMSGGAS